MCEAPGGVLSGTTSAETRELRAVASARGVLSAGRRQVSPRRAETPRGDRPDPRAAPAAAAGGEASPRPCALQASCRCASGAPRRGDALGLIYATLGPFHGALTALRGLPPRQRADSPPGAPEGKEACPEQAGGSSIKVLAARRPGLHSPPCAGTGSAAGSTGRGEGAALGLPNAWTICSRCWCNMLELQSS